MLLVLLEWLQFGYCYKQNNYCHILRVLKEQLHAYIDNIRSKTSGSYPTSATVIPHDKRKRGFLSPRLSGSHSGSAHFSHIRHHTLDS